MIIRLLSSQIELVQNQNVLNKDNTILIKKGIEIILSNQKIQKEIYKKYNKNGELYILFPSVYDVKDNYYEVENISGYLDFDYYKNTNMDINLDKVRISKNDEG